MKLIQITNIEKKDVPLYYRNEYTAQSEFVLIGDSRSFIQIYFSIEMAPTGEKSIDIKFTSVVNYPIVPLIQVLKKEISLMEQKGLLL